MLSGLEALKERAAQDGKNFDVRGNRLLEKDDLKFDRMLDRMAIVFHDDGVAGLSRQSLEQVHVDVCSAKRRHVRLSCESELFRRAVMRCPEDNKRPVCVMRAEPPVGG